MRRYSICTRSAERARTRACAIDTSILVRLATRRPKPQAESLLLELEKRYRRGEEFWISSMVLGEAYIAIQHHYGIPKTDIHSLLISFFESGWFHPMDGPPVLEALRSTSGPGLLDRLIALQGVGRGMKTLTLDRKMGRLPECEPVLLS